MSDNNSNENNNSSESEVTFPLKMLTPQNLQFLLNYIARDLGLVNVGKYKTTINGEWIHSDLEFVSDTEEVDYARPDCYSSYCRSAIVYNNEVHIFGSHSLVKRDTLGNFFHLIGDFSSWRNVGECPYQMDYNWSSVIYNNKIHLIGPDYTANRHFSWDGYIWKQESTLPMVATGSCVVVYNNKIHIIGGSGSRVSKHYSWDGNVWTEESTLSFNVLGYAVVYQNKIHVLSCNGSNKSNKHYSWNGVEWLEESTLPVSIYPSLTIVYQNKIHLFCYTNARKHYTWDGTTWTELNENIPNDHYEYPVDWNYNYPYNYSIFLYNNKIHILGNTHTDTSDNDGIYRKMTYMYYDPSDDPENPWKTYPTKTITKYIRLS